MVLGPNTGTVHAIENKLRMAISLPDRNDANKNTEYSLKINFC
jgi:hypothetical protein